MKLSLNTIILYVQNVDSLKNFYNDILGLEIIEDDGGIWTLLQAGNGYVGLHKMGDQYRNGREPEFKFHNNAKVVFELQDDINEARQTLIDKGVEMREMKTFDNYDYWLCDGEDPEGNVFQLKQRK